MEYVPLIQSAKPLRRHTIGAYELVLWGEIVSVGAVQYTYIVAVHREGVEEPVLYVAAEVNAMRRVFGGGSHFLAVFDDEGHHNYGASDRWGDADTFFTHAEELIRARLELSDA